MEALVARDQDLQQLRLGLESPAARPQLTWQQRQQAFDNYLHLIYGPGMLVSVVPPRTSLCPGPLTCPCALPPRVWILKHSPSSSGARWPLQWRERPGTRVPSPEMALLSGALKPHHCRT